MMVNDDAQKTLSGLLAQVVGGGTPRQPAERLLNDLLPYLSSGGSAGTRDVVSERTVSGLSAVPGANLGDSRAESGSALTEPMTQLARQLAELTAVARGQSDVVEANTSAVIENSLTQASDGRTSTAGSIGKTVLSFLGSGLGLVGLLGKLFGGKEETPAPSLTRYALPPAMHVEAGLAGLGIQPIQYGQDGLPRAVQTSAAPQATPITIQVQAIDSRSFLDHSAEIAGAVKDALLNSHSLNDVVVEL